MNPVPLLGLGVSSRSPNVTAQQRVNCFIEIQKDADKTSVAAYGTPGLTLFATFGDLPVRGALTFGDYIYAVHNSNVWRMDASGGTLLLGVIGTSTGRVGLAHNGFQLIIVDGSITGYTYTFGPGVFSAITDPGFPGADTVTFLNGYFIVNRPGTGQFFVSGSYDGRAWDPLDYATSESNPDNLVAVYAHKSMLLLFGEISTEIWGDVGALDFPFARIPGSAFEWGLAARWSIAKFDNALAFLAKNKTGQTQVVMFDAASPQRISTFDTDRIFNAGAVSDATAFSYMLNGHPFYEINFGNRQTWLYDLASDCWSQLTSDNGQRHRAELSIEFLARTLVTDYASGNLYELSDTEYTDNGTPIIMSITSKHVSLAMDRVSLYTLQLEMEAGVGLSFGQGSDPQVMMQVSKDGGHTWGAERFASMGQIGEYRARALWTKLGMARDFTFRFSISDPVKRTLLGAWVT